MPFRLKQSSVATTFSIFFPLHKAFNLLFARDYKGIVNVQKLALQFVRGLCLCSLEFPSFSPKLSPHTSPVGTYSIRLLLFGLQTFVTSLKLGYLLTLCYFINFCHLLTLCYLLTSYVIFAPYICTCSTHQPPHRITLTPVLSCARTPRKYTFPTQQAPLALVPF